MLPMLLAAGAGAGLGLLKSEFIDKENENKNREMQSITDRYSPWTGMRGKMVEPTNALGSAMSFGAQGAALGAGAEQMDQNKSFNDAMVKHLGGADGASELAKAGDETSFQNSVDSLRGYLKKDGAYQTPAMDSPYEAAQRDGLQSIGNSEDREAQGKMQALANSRPDANPTEFDALGGGDSAVDTDKIMQRLKMTYGNQAAYKSAFPQGM